MTTRLRFNAFSMNCVSHIHHGQWTRSDGRSMDYTDLDAWIELAQLLERGKFDALFLADVVGTYAAYGGSRDAAVEERVELAPLEQLGELDPGVQIGVVDRARIGPRPLAVVDMGDAVHREGVEAEAGHRWVS